VAVHDHKLAAHFLDAVGQALHGAVAQVGRRIGRGDVHDLGMQHIEIDGGGKAARLLEARTLAVAILLRTSLETGMDDDGAGGGLSGVVQVLIAAGGCAA
jgi:hypothetical protein